MRLEQMNHALILIILRFYEGHQDTLTLQCIEVPEDAMTEEIISEPQLILKLMSKPFEMILSDLSLLIETISTKRPESLPLLQFLKRGFKLSAELIKSPTPFTDAKLEKNIQETIKILQTLQSLLDLSQSKTIMVSFEDESFELAGLAKSLWSYSREVNFHELISNTLCPILPPKTETSAWPIFVSEAFHEYHNPLIIKALKKDLQLTQEQLRLSKISGTPPIPSHESASMNLDKEPEIPPKTSHKINLSAYLPKNGLFRALLDPVGCLDENTQIMHRFKLKKIELNKIKLCSN